MTVRVILWEVLQEAVGEVEEAVVLLEKDGDIGGDNTWMIIKRN
jgi:hypothetical protein